MKPTRTRAQAASAARRFSVAALAAVIVLALAAPAFGAVTVPLKSSHVGASSQTFSTSGDAGGLSSAVVWHFVLNGLDAGTPAAQLTVSFGSSGTKTATGRPVGNGKTQHFYVGTSAHDVISSASATVASAGFNQLVLSHVALNLVQEPPAQDPPAQDPPAQDPPVDDPPADDPPADDPPAGDPPADDPPAGDDPESEGPPESDEPTGTTDDPFLPFTEDPADEGSDESRREAAARNESDPFLPYTGTEALLLALTAGVASATGLGLRAYARKRGEAA